MDAISLSKVNGLRSQLNDIVQQDLPKKIGNGVLATMADLAQDVKTAMTGGSVAVVGGESSGFNNLALPLKNYFGKLEELKIAWLVGRYTNVGVFESNAYMYYTQIDAVEGDRFAITSSMYGTTWYAAIALNSSNGVVGLFLPGGNAVYTSYSDAEIVMPTGTSKLIVQSAKQAQNYVRAIKKYVLNNISYAEITTTDLEVGSYTGDAIVNTGNGLNFRTHEMLMDLVKFATFNVKVSYANPVYMLVTYYDSARKYISYSNWILANNNNLPNILCSSDIKASVPSACYMRINLGTSTSGSATNFVDFDGTLTVDIIPRKELSKKVTVDINGTGDFASVTEAVATVVEGTEIYILPGDYYGTVQAFQKQIILKGTDKERCRIISTDGRYDYPPINASCGYAENITFYAMKNGESADTSSQAGAYAVHCESDYSAGKELRFFNCNLISDFYPAIGAGLRPNFTLEFESCKLITNANAMYSSAGNLYLGTVYWHDSHTALQGGNQNIILKNCFIKAKMENVIVPHTMQDWTINQMYATFINNTVWSEVDGKLDSVVHDRVYPATGMWSGTSCKLMSYSYGNNVNRMNA